MMGTCRGNVPSPRDVFGVALAVLRQPVKTSATIANPAMTAARMVRSLTDTREPTLMTDPPHPAAPPRPQPRPLRAARPWGVPFAVVSMLLLGLIAVTALLPAKLVADKPVEDGDGNVTDVETPYALVPAAAQPVADRVSYGDLADDISVDTDLDGRVYFVTVSEPPQSILGHWVGEIEPEIEFTTHEEKYGSQTPSQQREVSLQMMYGSSQIAQYVALTRSGYDAEIIDGAVQVQQFLCLGGSGNRCDEYVPVAEELEIGDTVVSVDGVETPTLDELAVALADNEPGDEVEVTVDRQDVGEVSVDVTLLSASEDPANERDYHRPIIGFVPFDTRTVQLPFEIQIDTGEIGGPSAGLAFTLTLIDELTEGDLLGGSNVAVTGTIQLDGSVGPIGGLPQKVSAVRQAGIDYFIVPAAQTDLDEAQEIAGDDVELIPVADVGEALAALEDLGGDPFSD
jgi:PDZ domain-containing protein